MTVAELRKALADVPDDMTVLVYEEGYLREEDVTANVCRCAKAVGEAVLSVVRQGYGKPIQWQDAGADYLIIC